jgi:hypothetical protein
MRSTNNDRYRTDGAGKRRHRDYLVPLTAKLRHGRHIIPDPVVRPEAVRAKRRAADRRRKIAKTTERLIGWVEEFGHRTCGEWDNTDIRDLEASFRLVLEDVL